MDLSNMEIDTKNSIEIEGADLKIVIILPYFNESIGMELLKNAKEELLRNNVKPENIKEIRVAGTLEIPFAAQKVIEKTNPDAIIALGIVIRGETSHYDLVTEATHSGLMDVQLKTGTPIAFGVLACENEEQAKHRASKKGLNKGKQAAQAILIQTTI